MALITAIGQWNDFYMPMVLLGNKNVTTLILIIILYFAFSSQIVEGLTGGAVKG